MSTGQFVKPIFTGQDAATYKGNIDASFAAIERVANAYACYADAPAGMTVKVAAGAVLGLTGPVENGIQTSGAITAPVSNPRIDRVVIDSATGVVSIVAGTEAASPSVPAIPTGKVPCARFTLTPSTTAITNLMITDERIVGAGGGGSATGLDSLLYARGII